MIIVNTSINKGKPSVPNNKGGYDTVKCIMAFVNAGVSIEEVCAELSTSESAVMTAIEYVKLYPGVLT